MSFWQKVQRGVSQAAAEAGRQTAIARKNLEISGLKGDVRRKTNELGDAALELVRAGTLKHERLEALAAEIAALEERIDAAEQEIEASQPLRQHTCGFIRVRAPGPCERASPPRACMRPAAGPRVKAPWLNKSASGKSVLTAPDLRPPNGAARWPPPTSGGKIARFPSRWWRSVAGTSQ